VGDSAWTETLSPASRALPILGFVILGLAPQAVCYRSLRKLKSKGASLLLM